MSSRPCRFALLLLILLAPVTATGQTGLPDPEECTFTTRATAPVSVPICPDTDGQPLRAASLFGGDVMDATIEVYLRDVSGQPVALFPREDIWLAVEGVSFCAYYANADFNTTETGYTEFGNFLRGGGYQETPAIWIVINGNTASYVPIPWIRCNSPDINADGFVNLIDVARFSAIFSDEYDYAADFVWDGVLNLSDLGTLARHIGHQCP